MKAYLEKAGCEEKLSSVILSLSEAVKKIADAVRTADTGKAGTVNVYGEEQLAMDVLADKILVDILGENKNVGVVASEEMDGEKKLSGGEYAVCFDPLDGSSLFDVNLTVGTIIGIYRSQTFLGVKGGNQVAAMVAVYGPRTTVFLTVGNGVSQFTLRNNEFVMTHGDMKISEDGKMFAPGNLRACGERADYLKLVNYWCTGGYTLRYSGGMVPDITQILVKGGGIFTYPGYEKVPDGKLRLLYECAPMAMLMTQAGGMATDGRIPILEKVVESLEQRTPIFAGSKNEVEEAMKFLS
ncbi:fructose-1,6-bisphosphatase [Candidatus Peregrinibacteria bacterium]|nr:fructose-1,6-bisphosphatase [Candidatus Peregrinibacteria bacterium]